MPPRNLDSAVCQAFLELEHWQPLTKILPPEELLDHKKALFPLFSHLYYKTKELYHKLPPRKNGENPFLHPLNVVWNLKKANVQDDIAFGVGLLHDYVEELVDLYRQDQHIPKGRDGFPFLERYERQVFQELEADLRSVCSTYHLKASVPATVIQTLKLLTRHKRDFYYRSIAAIFTCPDRELKERALQVKLADRMHNILSVQNFGEEERMYQCFKNLFILNNAKKFIIDNYTPGRLSGKEISPTEKLFKKSGKATYDAFFTVLRLCSEPGFDNVYSILHLAFRKFAIERQGLQGVTEINPRERHPLRLYQGVVRKYDARLHHKYDTFDQLKKEEIGYCRSFFKDYHLTQRQLRSLVDYKDAYSLKEVVALLLYQPDYYISHFLCTDLFTEKKS